MMPSAEAKELLTALHAGGTWGYYWMLPGKSSRWWPVGRPAPIAEALHVFFGVHPCGQVPERYDKDRKLSAEAIRATLVDIGSIVHVFADIDAKSFGGDKGAALAHVQVLQPAPSVIVDSGGGFHVYWLLDAPFVFDGQADRERARTLQAAWIGHVGGDKGAKDLARVLRVPGTRNCKPEYGPDFPTVKVLIADYGRRYGLAELEGIAQPARSLPTTRSNGHEPRTGEDPGQH